MNAELKGIHSPDADLENGPLPIDSVFVQLMIGPLDDPGEESFDLMVCTSEARKSVVDPSDPESSRYLLVLDRIDPELIKRYVDEFLSGIDRATWQELAPRSTKSRGGSSTTTGHRRPRCARRWVSCQNC